MGEPTEADWDSRRRSLEREKGGSVPVGVTDRPARFWNVYGCLIICRPESRPLYVVAVLHDARDIVRILGTISHGEPHNAV